MSLALQTAAQNGLLALTVIPLLCLYFGAVAWCTFDAFDHTDYGLAWLFIFLFLGPISMPLYVWMSLAARRETSQRRLDEAAFDKRGTQFKFVSELERFRWIRELDPQNGTMYEPVAGLHVPQRGRAHFTDAQAEELLAADPAGAAEYLRDMHALALEDGDPLRIATYRHYLARLPDGPAQLQRLEPGFDPDRPPADAPRSLPF